MTRVTVYDGTPYDADNEVLVDRFYDEQNSKPDRIEAADGQEIHFDSDEWVEIYIDGEEVDGSD